MRESQPYEWLWGCFVDGPCCHPGSRPFTPLWAPGKRVSKWRLRSSSEQLDHIKSQMSSLSGCIQVWILSLKKLKKKKRCTCYLQANLRACHLLSAINRFDSFVNKIFRAQGICQHSDNPRIICLPYDGNRKLSVIRLVNNFLVWCIKDYSTKPRGS